MTILISLFLYLIFRLLSKYQISKYVRKYYFLKTVITLVLIEGNMVYFTYIAFGHFCLSFSFTWRDKLALVFTTLFFGLVVILAFSFYFLLGEFLKQKAGYFLNCYYRIHLGYFLITMKNLVRNFLRGIIYYFLHEFYLQELILLSIVEVIEAVITILAESKKKVFISKIFYSLELIINFLFVLLNFSLYFGVACDTIYFDSAMKSMALELQTITIYLMITAAVIGMIADLLPLNWLKKKQVKKAQHQDLNKVPQNLDKDLTKSKHKPVRFTANHKRIEQPPSEQKPDELHQEEPKLQNLDGGSSKQTKQQFQSNITEQNKTESVTINLYEIIEKKPHKLTRQSKFHPKSLIKNPLSKPTQ